MCGISGFWHGGDTRQSNTNLSDLVGRMADTLDYSNVVVPKDRFDPELIAEIQHHAPNQIEILDLDAYIRLYRYLVPMY